MNALQQTARALITHWDSPFWKQGIPTAAVTEDLRTALAADIAHKPSWKPLALWYEAGAENWDDLQSIVAAMLVRPGTTKETT